MSHFGDSSISFKQLKHNFHHLKHFKLCSLNTFKTMKTLNFSSPPELRIIGSHGEDHDDGGQVQGGGEGGAAVPAEEHRHRPFTGLIVLRREIRSEPYC